jgi:hypothetical protein
VKLVPRPSPIITDGGLDLHFPPNGLSIRNADCIHKAVTLVPNGVNPLTGLVVAKVEFSNSTIVFLAGSADVTAVSFWGSDLGATVVKDISIGHSYAFEDLYSARPNSFIFSHFRPNSMPLVVFRSSRKKTVTFFCLYSKF